MSGCGGGRGNETTSASRAQVPPIPNRVLGFGQCLKPAGAQTLNVPADSRRARRVLNRGELVRLRAKALARYVFIWEIRGAPVVHRVYVQSDYPVSVHTARSQALDVLAHPHQEWKVFVAFSNASPARTARIARFCLGTT
jgi:hypothetical protein